MTKSPSIIIDGHYSCSTRSRDRYTILLHMVLKLPPNRDVMQAIRSWNGKGCLVVNMAPQPLGRVFNASGKTVHGIRVEMKTNR
jgi:hypothetical protein